jgi:metal-responsive CopG/Arc/MetJ family transcriptional regulator
MTRITERLCISLPPKMAEELEQVRKAEHRTRSELVREALRQYFREKAKN